MTTIAPPQSPTHHPAPQTPKILVIDDDEIMLMQVGEALRQGGYKFLSADNGADGASIAEAEQPDIIILDRRMPEVDGNQTLIMLKCNPATSNIPVIMLTGDDRASDISTSFDLGAIDYIVKPFHYNDLLTRVRNALVRHSA